MKKLLVLILAVLSLNASAAIQTITIVPTAWEVRYYPGQITYGANGATDASSSLTIVKTGSSCGGTLYFSGSADDVKVFFQLLTTAKIAGSTIVVKYSDTSNCSIITFGPQ